MGRYWTLIIKLSRKVNEGNKIASTLFSPLIEKCIEPMSIMCSKELYEKFFKLGTRAN